jgi:preprotein translocase subunit SecD
MRRIAWMSCLAVFLFLGIVHAQSSRLSIRAASIEPVDGWQTMRVEHCQSRCTLWVSPTAALTEGDIEKALPEINSNGDTRVAVVFTEAAATKMRDLTKAQWQKPIALIVDDKLIWAPIVQAYHLGKESALTGSGPHGLTQEEVDLIMSILRPAQPR